MNDVLPIWFRSTPVSANEARICSAVSVAAFTADDWARSLKESASLESTTFCFIASLIPLPNHYVVGDKYD